MNLTRASSHTSNRYPDDDDYHASCANEAARTHQHQFIEAVAQVAFGLISSAAIAASRHAVDVEHALMQSLSRSFHGRDYASGEALTRRIISEDKKLHHLTRMHVPAFEALLAWMIDRSLLCNSRGASAAQKLIIFLIISGQGSFYRAIAFQFHHACSSISKYFHEVLSALVVLHQEVVKMPTTEELQIQHQPHVKLLSNRFRLFKGCIGAIDGSHLKAYVLKDENGLVKAWYNRKGYISQNVMAVCDLDGNFTYIYAGWEGSAHDGRVLSAARNKGFAVPQGYYLLGDAGYSQVSNDILVPYRGTRYHLAEWLAGVDRPRNPKELYNRRHSSLRNVVERAFGVLKRRWRLLDAPREFAMDTQVDLVYALAALHIWINKFQGMETTAAEEAALYREAAREQQAAMQRATGTEIRQSRREGNSLMEVKRLWIATQGWVDYEIWLAQQGRAEP